MNKNNIQTTKLSTIQNCPLFSALSPDQLSVLHAIAKSITFDRNEAIFSQGEECPGVFIVETGLVKVYRAGIDGRQHVLHLCGAGQSFAEVAVFGEFSLPASAIATQATSCVLIPREPLQAAIDENHLLCRQLLTGMAYWTRHFVQLLDDIVLRDAAGRVARLLGDLPTDQNNYVELPGPKKDIANHLNLSSETFSRVLRRLTDQQLIEVSQDRRIRIVARQQLEELKTV